MDGNGTKPIVVVDGGSGRGEVGSGGEGVDIGEVDVGVIDFDIGEVGGGVGVEIEGRHCDVGGDGGAV